MAGVGQLLPNDDPAMIGWNAPIPDLPALASGRGGSTRSGHWRHSDWTAGFAL